MEKLTNPAISRLSELGIPYQVFQHSGPVESLEQAAAERAQRPEQVVRSLVFRLPGDQFVMVLMAGPGQVPWKSLRSYLGLSRVTMATEEEVFTTTGCRPGTVNPFSLQQPMRILVDRRILALPEVSFGSCIRGTAIILTPANLLRALQAYEMVDFTA